MTKWILIYLCLAGFAWWRHDPTETIQWLIGVGLFACGWFPLFYKYEFFKRATMVQGKVVRIKGCWRPLLRSRPSIEVIAFKYGGEQREIEGAERGRGLLEIGTLVKVAVDPKNPKKAIVFEKDYWGPYVYLMLFSFLLSLPVFLSVIGARG